jgi:hypothetical protein
VLFDASKFLDGQSVVLRPRPTTAHISTRTSAAAAAVTPIVPLSASAGRAPLALAVTAPGRRQSPITAPLLADLVEPGPQAHQIGLVLLGDMLVENVKHDRRGLALG